ncbi:beta propeller repeat protein [Spirosoma jeollabukense]
MDILVVKKVFLFLTVLLVTVSCMHNDSPITSPATSAEDPDWIRLEIPTGREAYAIAGDIDKTLLVSTWSKAYYSTDQGKSWRESKDFQGPIPGLFVRNDTTFAMNGIRYDRQGTLLGACDPLYFTADYGQTWDYYSKYYKQYLDDILPIGMVKASTGTVYSIQAYSTPTAPGSTTSYVNPSEIRKQDTGTRQTVRFPFKHRLINLYVDTKNRVYVAASGGTYQPETNGFYCCEDTMPAVVYVSRRPLP